MFRFDVQADLEAEWNGAQDYAREAYGATALDLRAEYAAYDEMMRDMQPSVSLYKGTSLPCGGTYRDGCAASHRGECLECVPF